MGTPIYKITEYVNWKGTSPIFSGASAGGGVVIPEPAGGGLDGSGAAGQIAFWLDNNTVVGDEGLTYNVDSSGEGELIINGIVTFNDGSVGTLPAKTSEAYVVYYNVSTGKISYGSNNAGGVSLTGATDNALVTVAGANAIQEETNLTFDGSDLQNKSGDMYANDFILIP
jgi:hypothetical protein